MHWISLCVALPVPTHSLYGSHVVANERQVQIRNYERNQQSFRLCAEKLGEKLPNDFRTEKEFGSILFPLVNVSSILRNADKDETSCITA